MSPVTAAKHLLAWYDRQGRELPWRRTTDPYRVLVSEVMAQQTQISRVLPFYERWLSRFPDWVTLAKASTAEVIMCWSGLGYNRRALMLQNIARQVVERGIPSSEEEWLELKGIGPYTAAALTVFSLGTRAVPIDTNIRRVVGRWLLGVPMPELSHDQRVREILTPVVDRLKRFADFFQALFDLGATICLKKPKCPSCPLYTCCSAAGIVEDESWKPPPRRPSGERIRPGKRYPDRIFRGRILRQIQAAGGGLLIAKLGPLIDNEYDPEHDAEWVTSMLARLEKDGLIRIEKRTVRLP